MISGMYMGELVRLILVKMARDQLLFQGKTTPELLTTGCFSTNHIFTIESDKIKEQPLGHSPSCSCETASHHEATRRICQIVSTRAAHLCASTLAAVMRQIRDNKAAEKLRITIGVDGSCGSGKGAAMVTAVAYRLTAQHTERQRILDTLRLSREQLFEVKRRMTEEMARGLSKQTHDQTSVKMLPTYVQSTLNGTEQGDFLALDLGGSSFRVLLVQLKSEKKQKVDMHQKIYRIDQETMQGTGEEGILLKWTKGFKASGCEGKDVVMLLKEAVQRKKVCTFEIN
ncbi:hypothetical protein GOODEAATRI_017354 [Goodea atripinnis]|uniref:Phosphotransferase n=1 Tax=Goodea atripinnis TaxID=208336 RepID=A0ABV0NBB7_9TELE